ncbi:MAG: STAS domain-containing protein [Oceanospirillaceae bacterium]|nr:STAS domain-containing protein [Oceanospirillaceae bacterium]
MTNNTIMLQSDMTIGNIRNCQAKLLSLLGSSEEVFVDVTNLQQIDTSGIQLLLLFVLEAKKLDLKVSWLNSHEMLEQMVMKLGLEEVLSFK